jgi:hypothetical protein
MTVSNVTVARIDKDTVLRSLLEDIENMIKEKITPELKRLFRDAINNTMDTGIEHGFLLCLDNKGNITPTNVCKGNECEVKLPRTCPVKMRGNFHTHPILAYHNREMAKAGLQKFSKKNLLYTIKEVNKLRKDKYDSQSPSRADALSSLTDKCRKISNGTVCIGNDLGEDVKCWTPKEIRVQDCARAFKELAELLPKEKTEQPEQWAKDLFDIEAINVKRSFIDSLLGR